MYVLSDLHNWLVESVSWSFHFGISINVSMLLMQQNKKLEGNPCVLIYARVKGRLEPTHLKSSPLFPFSTKSLRHDSPSIHLFFKMIGSRFTTTEIKLGEDSPSFFFLGLDSLSNKENNKTIKRTFVQDSPCLKYC